MKIALLGGGHVGAALGIAWAGKGHELFFGVRDPEAPDMKEALDACRGLALAGTPAQAAAHASVIVIALPWSGVDAVLRRLDLAGKVLIDCTNPPAGLESAEGKPVSGAEFLAARFPQAKVVKCFNTTGANNMANPVYPDGAVTMFVCSDEAEAKSDAMRLSNEAGFDTYDLGPLANARLMESMAQVWIWLAYRGGLGREFAFRLVRR